MQAAAGPPRYDSLKSSRRAPTVPAFVVVFLAAFIAARSTVQTSENITASQASTSSFLEQLQIESLVHLSYAESLELIHDKDIERCDSPQAYHDDYHYYDEQNIYSAVRDSQESHATSPHKHLANDYVVGDGDEVYDAYTVGTHCPVPTAFVSPVPDEPIRPVGKAPILRSAVTNSYSRPVRPTLLGRVSSWAGRPETKGPRTERTEQSFKYSSPTSSLSFACTAITSVHRFLIFTFKALGVHLTLPHFDIVVGYRWSGRGSLLVESPLMGTATKHPTSLPVNHQYFSGEHKSFLFEIWIEFIVPLLSLSPLLH
ncbi:hypothetical protein ARMGADRAFT_1124087 [Armillaria gallica]|uniref:Uncharacterized protein n=1 Tax=Armillaria gallica TaxID=47427 RepID=A0A2H3EI95_ARMGA|nr:hypothetical protein ARMGADRAFT_1124087 [Armillaria gallica]